MSRLVRFVVVLVCALLPALAWAQAEPAPEGYVPPGKREPESPPPSPLKWHIGVNAGLVVPFERAKGLPVVGWGAGIELTRALVTFGRGRFGLGADFGYHRVEGTPYQVVEFGPLTAQTLSHMTFSGLLVLDGIFGRVRPWLVAGPGLSVAQYENPPPSFSSTGQGAPTRPNVSANAVVPLIHVAAGLAIEIYHGIDLGLGGELDFTFSSLSVDTPLQTVFAPGLFVLRLDLGFRF